MKKGIAPLFIILAVFLIGGIGIFSSGILKKTDTGQQQIMNEDSDEESVNIFKDQTDLCQSINKDTVQSFLGKTIIKTQSITDNALQSCQYYLDETHALVLNYDFSGIAGKIKGHESLGRTISSNDSILMKNYVVTQENGLINEIYLVFSDAEFISINRPNSKLISEEEIINFAIKLANFFQNGEPDVSEKTNGTVPLPREEDVVTNFFNLINERKVPEAISMMSKKMTGDDSAKQAWGVQFNDIKSINVMKIEPSSSHTYKVTLEAYVSSDAANAPIPFYGWEDNPNIRWVELVKEDNVWKINSLATGP